MVHPLGNEDADTADIARQHETDDLAAAVLQQLVAASPPTNDQSHAARGIALVRDVVLGGDLPACASPDRVERR